MGCDIHLYRERKINGVWTSLEKWVEEDNYEGGTYLTVPYDERPYSGRNYDFFGALCFGVRREFDFSFIERGVPHEMDEKTAEVIRQWGEDGHSHSYLYLHELKDFREFLNHQTTPISGMMDREQLRKLQESIKDGNPDWELLYPYCQSTNDPRQVEFDVNVPSSFAMGDSLDQVISSFDGIEGAPHELRIVFFFDN